MGLVIQIIAAPMVAYFMTLVWSAMFGDSVTYLIDNSMIEEWFLCMQIYVGIVIIRRFKCVVMKK